MLLLCALIVGVGTSWAQSTVTFDYADYTGKGTTSTGSEYTMEKAGIVSITNTKFFGNNSQAHFYANGTTTVTPASGITITQIDLTATNTSYNGYQSKGTVTASTGTVSANGTKVTWTGSATEAFTISNNKQIRWTSIVVTYTQSSDPNKETVTLSFPEDSYTVDINDGFASAPKATADKTITGIKYSSSNTTVATVDEETGAVTLNKVGTTTIKATFAGNDDYNAAEASYTLVVKNRNANDGTEAKPFTVEEAIENTPATGTSDNYYIKGIVSKFQAADIVSDGSNYRYYISDNGTTNNQLLVYKGKGLNNVAFANADDLLIGDEVVILGGLTTYSGASEIAANNYIVSRKTKADPNLTVEESVELYVDQQKAVSELYLIEDDYTGVVSFTSSDETVAKVEGDVLKALAVGTAVITVTAAADDNYKTASETIAVTVKSKDVTPVGAGGGNGYYLVTDATTLEDGDQVLVVCESKSMVMGAQSGTKCDNVEVTIADYAITAVPTGANVVTLEKDGSGWYLNTAQGYLTSTVAKSLKVEGNKENASKVTITISDGNAEIDFGTSIGTLQYNASSPRFCTYTSTQTAVQIYRYVETSSFDIEIGEAGYRTIVTAADVEVPEGVTAYVVASKDGETATLAEVSTLKANEPYILNGAKGTYTLTVTEEASDPAVNLLQVSTESTGNGVYVLAKGSNGAGFYKWNGGQLGAGRVYLPASAAAGAPDFIGLGTTTGIEVVKSAEKVLGGEAYNLAGQKVGAGYKGIVIVNGKKAVMK